MINNGATTVGFPTFTLQAKINKEITLDSGLPFKYRHSHPDYNNLRNDFNNTTVSLIHDKSATPTRSAEESAAYNLHRVEQVSIKVSTPTLHATQSKRVSSRGGGCLCQHRQGLPHQYCTDCSSSLNPVPSHQVLPRTSSYIYLSHGSPRSNHQSLKEFHIHNKHSD